MKIVQFYGKRDNFEFIQVVNNPNAWKKMGMDWNNMIARGYYLHGWVRINQIIEMTQKKKKKYIHFLMNGA